MALNLRFECIRRFSLKKEDWRCVTLVCLLHKILIYNKNIAKRRPSWIFSLAHKSWTKWPILTNLTFLSLSQPAEKNDTRYDLYFTKNKKNEFLPKARAAILDLVRLRTLGGSATKFFCRISVLGIKWHHFEGSSLEFKSNIPP